MKPIKPYGDAGTLVLPWQDFSVPIYLIKNNESGQDICDLEDAAVYKRNYGGGHCDYIGDHQSQGFGIIRELKFTHPAIIQTPTSTKIYRWAATMLGTNTGTKLIACSGQNLPNVKWADLCLYTCNDAKGRDITMVFLKLQETVDYPMYDVEEGAKMAINFSNYIYSKGTHYISNSGSDENKKYTGGKAGDQTGSEWCLKAWYNRPWSVVLRYPDYAVAKKIAELSIAAALNNKIGYDQGQRTTYWTQLRLADYNPSKITTPCEEDCTAGVSANVKAAGYIFGIKALEDIPICTSRNMKSQFVKAGFKALTASKYLTSGNYLLPGDILLYENHHAAANVTIGKYATEPSIITPTPTTPNISDKENIPPVVGYVKVENGVYYVRREDNKNGKVIGTVKSGDNVPYLGVNQNGWYKVFFNSEIGWLSNKAGSIDQRNVEYYTIKGGSWHVRSGASSSFPSLGVVHGGDKLVSMGLTMEDWAEVEFNGGAGWISQRAIAT